MGRPGQPLDADTVDATGGGRTMGTDDGEGLFADRYRIERLIGRGGMGAVYKAVDELLGEPVAIKVVDLGDTPQPSTIERLRREVRLARKVTHPNVARTHDVGEWRGRHFLTMELVEGTDLEALLEREKPLRPSRAVPIAIAIAEGLAAAHAAGIVHRDLKPANVLVAHDHRVLLTDFGIAKSLAEMGLSRTTGTMGTLLYMAPEQVRGLAGDRRTDVYAFGLVLYEMLSGTYPFLEATAIATALARLDREAPELRGRTSVDDDLSALVASCLKRDPNDRPQAIGDVAAQLRAWLSQHPSATVDLGPAISTALRTPPNESSLRLSQLPVTREPLSGELASHRSLAVLPFRYQGPPEHEYLSETLADEVIDALSRTQGLRVLASGVTTRFAGARDPRRVGAELGVHAVVDGTVHCRAAQNDTDGRATGASLRLAARLLDVATGAVLTSERFESPLRDVLGAQDAMSRRIAEALRVSLAVAVERDPVPSVAVESYLRARHAIAAARFTGVGGALDLLQECLAVAPGYRPAVAAYALAAARSWFLPGRATLANPAEVAAKAIESALALAPDFPETHVAAAVQHVHRSELAESARALSRALAIAPSYAGAHASLGMLLVEAGRIARGMHHLELARDLEPTASGPTVQIARSHALAARWDAYERTMATVDPRESITGLLIQIRVAAWRSRHDELRALREVARERDSATHNAMVVYAAAVLGELTPQRAEDLVQQALAGPLNPRFAVGVRQYFAEVYAMMSDVPNALASLGLAVELGLADLEWLESCPALASLRGTPELEAAKRAVLARADAIAVAAGA